MAQSELLDRGSVQFMVAADRLVWLRDTSQQVMGAGPQQPLKCRNPDLAGADENEPHSIRTCAPRPRRAANVSFMSFSVAVTSRVPIESPQPAQR